MQLGSDTKVKQQLVRAVIIRANGTREDKGVVAAYHMNPFINAAFQLKIKLKRLIKWP